MRSKKRTGTYLAQRQSLPTAIRLFAGNLRDEKQVNAVISLLNAHQDTHQAPPKKEPFFTGFVSIDLKFYPQDLHDKLTSAFPQAYIVPTTGTHRFPARVGLTQVDPDRRILVGAIQTLLDSNRSLPLPIGISVANAKSSNDSSPPYAALYFHTARDAILFVRSTGSINLPKIGFVPITPRFIDLEGQANGILKLTGFSSTIKDDTVMQILDDLNLERNSYVFSKKAKAVNLTPFPPTHSLTTGDCLPLSPPRPRENLRNCFSPSELLSKTRTNLQWARKDNRRFPSASYSIQDRTETQENNQEEAPKQGNRNRGRTYGSRTLPSPRRFQSSNAHPRDPAFRIKFEIRVHYVNAPSPKSIPTCNYSQPSPDTCNYSCSKASAAPTNRSYWPRTPTCKPFYPCHQQPSCPNSSPNECSTGPYQQRTTTSTLHSRRQEETTVYKILGREEKQKAKNKRRRRHLKSHCRLSIINLILYFLCPFYYIYSTLTKIRTYNCVTKKPDQLSSSKTQQPENAINPTKIPIGPFLLTTFFLMVTDIPTKYQCNQTEDDLTIWSHNINGSHQEKIDSTIQEALENNIQILCLQETKMREEDEKQFQFSTAHHHYVLKVDNLNLQERILKRDKNLSQSSDTNVRAPQNNPPGSEGLLIGIRRKHKNGPPCLDTQFWPHPSHRFLSASICLQNNKIIIIHNCYAPNSTSSYPAFLQQLTEHDQSIRAKITAQEIFSIFIGDFNATFELSDTTNNSKSSIRHSPDLNKNLFLDFVHNNKLFSPIKELIPDSLNKFTYHKSATSSKTNLIFLVTSLIDHALIPEQLRPQVTKAAIEIGLTESDHHPISISINWKAKMQNNSRPSNPIKKPMLKVRTKENDVKLTETLEDLFLYSPEFLAADSSSSLYGTIYSKLRELVGVTQKSKKNKYLKDNILHALRKSIKSIRKMLKKIYSAPTTNETKISLQKLIKSIFDRGHNNPNLGRPKGEPSEAVIWLKNTLKFIINTKQQRAKIVKTETIKKYIQKQVERHKTNPKEFYRRALGHSSPAKFQALTDPTTNSTTFEPAKILEILENYWKNTFTATIPQNNHSDKWRSPIHNPKNAHKLIEAITIEELEEALQSTASNTSPGPTGIPAEVWKAMGTKAKSQICDFLNDVFSTKKIPKEWKLSMITLIEKDPSQKSNPAKYRPIALLDNLYKIFTLIITKRLTRYCQENKIISNLQAGSQKGRSTTEQISALIAILEDAKTSSQEPIIVTLIDIIKAYDNVEHWAIKKTLQDYAVPSHLIDLIMALYEDNVAFISTPHGDTKTFPCTKGVRQGDTLSPLLFILVINPILKYIENNFKGYQFKRNRAISIPLLAFVDDIVLIADDVTSMNNMLLNLNDFLKVIGLSITDDPSKTIVKSNLPQPYSIALQQNKRILTNQQKSLNTLESTSILNYSGRSPRIFS